jgi:hypothetical protein
VVANDWRAQSGELLLEYRVSYEGDKNDVRLVVV